MFDSNELLHWSAKHGRRPSPRAHARPNEPSGPLSIEAAIERGGVYHDIVGATPHEIFGAIAQLRGVPDHVERDRLCEELRGREALASTGVGDGIAIPHARDPMLLNVQRPTILLGFLRQPVEFHAIDGVPVKILFTLLSPTIPLHLQMLSRLTNTLHDDDLKTLLSERAPWDAIRVRLRELDVRMT